MRAFVKHSILLVVLFSSLQHLYAQHSAADTIKVYGYVTASGDTIPMSYLPNVLVAAHLSPQQKKRWAEWTRLRNAVYVTYPYAKSASKVMNEINAKLVGVTDKKQRKAIIRSKEKELKRDFADKLTQLSVYQGKVLMKLIYRETGNNCYEIIDEYKGSFTAAFWQTVAVIFGSNLKQNYDPVNADHDMELIVQDVAKMYGYKS
jgi:tRNA G10  N-methylase Trm11